MRFMYSAEINKLKGIVSASGQIEKVIDYNDEVNDETVIQCVKEYDITLIDYILVNIL